MRPRAASPSRSRRAGPIGGMSSGSKCGSRRLKRAKWRLEAELSLAFLLCSRLSGLGHSARLSCAALPRPTFFAGAFFATRFPAAGEARGFRPSAFFPRSCLTWMRSTPRVGACVCAQASAVSKGCRLQIDELDVSRELAGGRDPPRKRVRELWIATGRRVGRTTSLRCSRRSRRRSKRRMSAG
jgi:hypothetical protein